MYSGVNSLNNKNEYATTITTTLFFDLNLKRGFKIIFNPELFAGNGFSGGRGIAGFPNGEVYRVSDPTPKIYVARILIDKSFKVRNQNQLNIRIGKFSIIDYFDKNKYSSDPRSVFFNLALLGSGAYDYPSNARGYTYGLCTEYSIKNTFFLRFGEVMVPLEANGLKLDPNVSNANSEVIEIEKRYKTGSIKLLSFFTNSRMGNYNQSIKLGESLNTNPNIILDRSPGRTKYGLALNIEQELNENLDYFLRASWNDGLNETWAFTEIDKNVSLGWLYKSNNFKLGISFMANGLSTQHKKYLEKGGLGFMLGDGNLNYSPECIAEFFCSYTVKRLGLSISPDYQYIINPGYNMDRSDVRVFGLRVHMEM